MSLPKGFTHSQETKDKISKRFSGTNHPMFGKHHTEETRKKISLALIGKPAQGPPKGRIPWNKGIENWQIGENNPNWKGGTSREPYSFEFGLTLKEIIRKRDNYICQICGIPQDECIRKLYVHHIDYNKKNSSHPNLIALCSVCSSKVNANRDYWKTYLYTKQLKKYPHFQLYLLLDIMPRRRCSEETRRKISHALKGRTLTPEWKYKISISRIGRKFPRPTVRGPKICQNGRIWGQHNSYDNPQYRNKLRQNRWPKEK